MTHKKTDPRLLAAVLTTALTAALAGQAHAQEYVAQGFDGTLVTIPDGSLPNIIPGQDDATITVDLPFEFPFFGELRDQVSICTNGWMALEPTTSTASGNTVLPAAAAPNTLLAPLWDDLTTGSGSVFVLTQGAAPTRTFVVAWEGVDTFARDVTGGMSFQVHLHESTGVIEFIYADTGTWGGLSFTAGLENDNGSVAFGAPNLAATNSGRPQTDQRFFPRISNVVGMLRRDRPVASTGGLGLSIETGLPVRETDLEVRDADSGALLVRGRTDESGGFSLVVQGVAPSVRLDLDVLASGAAAVVTDVTGAVYRRRLADELVADSVVALGTLTLDATVDDTDPTFRPALNIQQATVPGLALAQLAAGAAAASTDPAGTPEGFPRLEYRWVRGAAAGGGSGYTPAPPAGGDALARIDDSFALADAYDDAVILRAYGEHVLAAISVHPGPVFPRSFLGATTNEGAWVDGFAHWFAAATLGVPTYIDTQGLLDADAFDLEVPNPAPARGPDVTGAVAATLWDLMDPANEPEDRVDGTSVAFESARVEILATIDLALDGGTTPGPFEVRDFFAAWRAGGPDLDREQAARVFIRHGTLPDDTFEANDDAGEEATLPGGQQKFTDLTLSPFNTDRFVFTLVGSADDILNVTVQQGAGSTTEFDVEILDAGGGLIASATNLALPDAERISVRATTAAAVAPGAYIAVVRWRGGSAGNGTGYTLTFGNPFRLLRDSLPVWTAGVPFKEDFTASGGVTPYTFGISGIVPGLLPLQSNTQLGGTPTTSGDFNVTISVTDSGAPIEQVSTKIPLRINAALGLPPIFPIAQGSAATADISRGGTLPTWTAGTPAQFGLTLLGGDSLRLSGTTSQTGLFRVSGRAVDAVGAVLVDTPVDVVVAVPLDSRRSVSTVPTGGVFGVAIDALAGSEIKLNLRFGAGSGFPQPLRVLDATGAVVKSFDTSGNARRRARVRNIVAPTTGRYFLIFANDNAFTGEVRTVADVQPTRRRVGQGGILTPGATVDVDLQALAGSKLSVRMQRGNAPGSLQPTLLEILGPDREPIALNRRERHARRGRVARIDGIVLPVSGTYTLRIRGREDTTGPLDYRYVVRAPRGALLDLDSDL